MSNKELTKLAFKIFSIYVMVQAILAVPQFFQAYVMISNFSEYGSENWLLAIGAISIILLAMLSAFIWKLSINIHTQVISESSTSSSNISESFILSVLGLYLIVFGLTRLSITSSSTYFIAQATSDVDFNITQNIIYLAVYLVVVMLGLSLVIKTKGWAQLLNKLRVAGT